MLATAVSNNRAESRTNKFAFMAASVGGLFQFVRLWHFVTNRTHALKGRFRRIANKGPPGSSVDTQRLTQQRQWLCTAAIVLMPVQTLSMYSFKPIRCGLLNLGDIC